MAPIFTGSRFGFGRSAATTAAATIDFSPYPSCDATGSRVDTIGSGLDGYIPGGWTRSSDYTTIFTNNQTGILVNQDGTTYFVIGANSSVITIKWIVYDGSGNSNPTVSLNTAKNWTGTTTHPASETGNGSSGNPSIGTYNVTPGVKYYVRTGLSGAGNPALVVYVTGAQGACIN